MLSQVLVWTGLSCVELALSIGSSGEALVTRKWCTCRSPSKQHKCPASLAWAYRSGCPMPYYQHECQSLGRLRFCCTKCWPSSSVLKGPRFLSSSSYERCSSPYIIFVGLHLTAGAVLEQWPCSSKSVSSVYCSLHSAC